MRREKIMIGTSTEYPLNGILTLPETAEGKVPAAVLVHGSGPSDMNEAVGKLTPFLDIAEGLAARGIASLRYDKRTFAHRRRCMKEKNITIREETIIDAVRAAELLRSDPRIDPERIFIIGHSMGAMLAPRIDAEGGNFRGLILMAGSLRTLDEIMISQLEAIESSGGLIGFLTGKQKKKYAAMFSRLQGISDEEAKNTNLGGGLTLYYFKEMNAHPAASYLADCEKPVLILQGEKDFQATVKDDYASYQKLLDGRDNVTFRLFPGLDHAFVQAMYDSALKANKEYGTERHIPDEVIDTIARHILQN